MQSLVPTQNIAELILFIRGQKVLLDSDLAVLYGVTTKRLNEQVKRNRERFPEDFLFQLVAHEKDELVANCDRFNRLKHSSVMPYAFTEHGALMLASVLNSAIAVQASIFVVRAFIKLRQILTAHAELDKKLTNLENRLGTHDKAIRSLFNTIRQLMAPPPSNGRKIGFLREK